MKKELKGAIIGGITGLMLSLLLIIFGSNESIFHKPLDLTLKLVCGFSDCSDTMGFAIFSIVFTIIFYTLIGVLIGILFTKRIYHKIFLFFLFLILSIYSVQAYTYEYSSYDRNMVSLDYSTAVRIDNISFNDSAINEKDSSRFSVQYNNQWDNHLLDALGKLMKMMI